MQERKIKRPEMQGPTDISDLLGGLKKTAPVAPSTSKSPINTPFMSEKKTEPVKEIKNVNIPRISDTASNDDAGSTISLSELKELQVEGTGPKRSRRRKGSEKNTISLDI